MSYRCVVPNCKGNYKNGPKVHVFSFPKDKELSDVWMRTIKFFSRVIFYLFLFILKNK